MNKIICEVCGTAYPETADQCPICGCARPAGAVPTSDAPSTREKGSAQYTYVKGGRYSAKNVRKRNQGKQPATGRREEAPVKPEKKPHSNKGLVITAIILLLAILLVAAFIFFRFFAPDLNLGGLFAKAETTVPTTSQTPSTAPSTQPDLSCKELSILSDTVELDEVGQYCLLNVTPVPENTTDTITYLTANPAVATVNEEGRVTAVGSGQTTITIRCGNAEVTCRVVCIFPAETTQPPTTEATLPDIKLELNREDFTLSFVGDQWQLYDGEIDPSLIKWTVEDESVAKVEDGLVVSTGFGVTTIHAEYNGQKVDCIVRCMS